MSGGVVVLIALTLAALIAAVLLLLIHKVRRIHVSTYELRENVAATRREVESLFAQFQSLLALERLLDLRGSLPAMRGWAGSPDFLLSVAEHVMEQKPRTVVECSSGVSTLTLVRCLQLIGQGHVYSLEHEPEYARKTREHLKRLGLSDWATVLHAPLVRGADGADWYDENALPADLPPIELLVIDGPPASDNPEARYPALPRLMPRLASAFTVMLDDANRPGERAIVSKWCGRSCVRPRAAAPALRKRADRTASPGEAHSGSRLSLTTRSSTVRRRHIQSLLDVAVLLVVPYHAGVPFVRGGYVGVDALFVISGLLITGLLVREVDERGRRIDYVRFVAGTRKARAACRHGPHRRGCPCSGLRLSAAQAGRHPLSGARRCRLRGEDLVRRACRRLPGRRRGGQSDDAHVVAGRRGTVLPDLAVAGRLFGGRTRRSRGTIPMHAPWLEAA